MNLEELNKTQVILLTLLVSFVTSIATGIMTASLLEEAPPTLTQTINRVVERTVEKVVPDTSGKQTAAAATVTKEKETTVVVKEDDLITDAIDRNSKSLVRLSRGPQFVEAGGNPFASIGVVLTSDGLIATDDAVIAADIGYLATLPDGTVIPAEVVLRGSGSIALLKLQPEKQTTFAAITIGSSDSLKLGQTLVGLSGRDRTTVVTGIVSGLINGAKPESGNPPIVFVETNLSGGLTPGAPILNIFGDVVGLSTAASRSHSSSTITPASSISEMLKSLAPKPPST